MKELEHEYNSTKKLLERVPFDKFDWQPHEKSMKLGRLAVHIAEIPRWVSRILSSPEFDLSQSSYQSTKVHSTEELVTLSHTVIGKAIADLNTATDEDMMAKWTFRRGEQVMLNLPRAAAMRTIAMNHMIHHRGQLSVYLRLLNISIPGMYGPSADERF